MHTQAVIDHIVSWLRNYSQTSRTKGFVVGVSGGIDSAVTASLCARTEMPVLLLSMPIYQSKNQVNRGDRLIAQLESDFSNVRSHNVELTGVFDALIHSLPEAEESPQKEMSLVNARARLRMTTLYYFAGLEGKLVAGTGNKVEDFGVGFFTKYGDGGVDLSPIADLMKSEVYALGIALGVDEEILSAPPTDGLWGDDRTDEDQIGATYPELEWAMGYKGNQSDLDHRQKEVLQIYHRLHKMNRHKMEPIPVCIIPASLR